VTNPNATEGIDLLLAIRDHAGVEATELETEALELERKAEAKRERAKVLRSALILVERNS
jgi:hypothetical protein